MPEKEEALDGKRPRTPRRKTARCALRRAAKKQEKK